MSNEKENIRGKFWQKKASPTKITYINEYSIGNTVLDIGCGYGYYGIWLQEKGFIVQGVDIEPQNLPYPVVKGAIHDLSDCNPADTVLAFDVLEHEEDEMSALSELRRVTQKRLIMSVPHAGDATLHQYNLTFKHHIDKTHWREYMPDELEQKLESVGFSIVCCHLEGAVLPDVFSEFFPRFFRKPIKILLKIMRRLRLLRNQNLFADVYVVAEPV